MLHANEEVYYAAIYTTADFVKPSLCAVSELCYEVSSLNAPLRSGLSESTVELAIDKKWPFLFQHLEMPNLRQLTAVLLAHSCVKCSGGESGCFLCHLVSRLTTETAGYRRL